MWLDLGYSHFLKILPFVQHIRIRLELVALGLVIAHFISSRRVWTQFLMIHLVAACSSTLPFIKIFGKIFAIVASGEEWSISWLRIVTILWTYACLSQEFSIFLLKESWTFVFSSFSTLWSQSKFPCSIDLRFELVDMISRQKFRLLLFLTI